MRMLTFEPLTPPALWLLLAAGATALLATYAWRRPAAVSRARWFSSLALIAAGVIGVMVVLLNPTWLETQPPPAGKPRLTILLDASASMATSDAAGGRTRFAEAAATCREVCETARASFDVRVQTFAGLSVPADLGGLESVPPEGMSTDLAEALSGAIEEGAPGGEAILLLSDGIHNAGTKMADVVAAARIAKAMDAPIYAAVYGGDVGVRDLSIEAPSAQEFAFVGQQIQVTPRVRQSGLALSEATIILKEEENVVGRQRVRFDEAGIAEASFSIKQTKTGAFRYEASVEPFPGEATLANNDAPLLLRVFDKPIRVLLLEGKPYWDAKFLTRTLTLDPSLELDSLVMLAENRLLHRSLGRPAAAAEDAVPKGAALAMPPKDNPSKDASKTAAPGEAGASAGTKGLESWKMLAGPQEVLLKPDFFSAYQIIVLGRNAEDFLTDDVVTRLRKWVESENGALVCYRGAPLSQTSQQFARMMPVKWEPRSESRFHVQITDHGRNYRWLSTNGTRAGEVLGMLPALATTAQTAAASPIAVIVARSGEPGAGPESPVITFQAYGGGRVVVIEGSGMWRWAFLPPQFRQFDDVYGTLWRNLLRWLISDSRLLPGQKCILWPDKVSFGSDEPATATVQVREQLSPDAPLQVELTGEGISQPKTIAAQRSGEATGSTATYRAQFGILPEGRYRARILGAIGANQPSASAAFLVRNNSQEKLDLASRPELMKRIASEGGGALLADRSGSGLIAAHRENRSRARFEKVTRRTAWDRPIWLLLILGAWCAGWKIRRSGGML